jgi:hypothetical protein
MMTNEQLDALLAATEQELLAAIDSEFERREVNQRAGSHRLQPSPQPHLQLVRGSRPLDLVPELGDSDTSPGPPSPSPFTSTPLTGKRRHGRHRRVSPRATTATWWAAAVVAMFLLGVVTKVPIGSTAVEPMSQPVSRPALTTPFPIDPGAMPGGWSGSERYVRGISGIIRAGYCRYRVYAKIPRDVADLTFVVVSESRLGARHGSYFVVKPPLQASKGWSASFYLNKCGPTPLRRWVIAGLAEPPSPAMYADLTANGWRQASGVVTVVPLIYLE